jgi:hypothetical protein
VKAQRHRWDPPKPSRPVPEQVASSPGLVGGDPMLTGSLQNERRLTASSQLNSPTPRVYHTLDECLVVEVLAKMACPSSPDSLQLPAEGRGSESGWVATMLRIEFGTDNFLLIYIKQRRYRERFLASNRFVAQLNMAWLAPKLTLPTQSMA